ncbi:hypothetical protein [Marinobacter salarius]|uniref:hypothetical protein n=1 Tax=Marinobacter salarius TaxID=1420917 RepID=UPI0018F1F256|nr:hypothetical protein [Marinobacter salarius]MBJ7301707.1 hypothetical protein [Marinobacter salarius]HIO29934.1 hypothetical protein [Marinobacter salarius]HIP00305.1 hypothetical protein [Marinobacter salarius]
MNNTNRLQVSVLIILFTVILQGCANNSNYETAELRKGWKSEFVLFVSGERQLMAHDPISAIFGGAGVATNHIHFNKLNQNLSEQEIIVTTSIGEVTGLVGQVFINNEQAYILLIQNGEPYSFNGNYQVKEIY